MPSQSANTSNDTTYYELASTVRAQTPEQTLATITALFPQLGITRLANITGLDTLNIPVVMCVRPNSQHVSVSQGKGDTLLLAKISAAMESIEGYHLENPKPTDLTGSYHELINTHSVLSPELFTHPSIQYKNSHSHSMGWARTHDVISNQEYYIPHSLTHLNTSEWRFEYSFLNVTSNGIAAGNTRDEAICHALYELIERNAIFDWHSVSSDKQHTQLILPESIDYTPAQNIIKRIQQNNLLINLWEVTNSIGVPTIYCELIDPNATTFNSFTGAGTHLNKHIALMRALTEAAQTRLTLISGSRDDIFPEYYRNRSPSQYNDTPTPTKSYVKCYQPEYQQNFTQNISQLCKLIQAAGYERILMVEHTKKEIGIPVIQMFIPAMSSQLPGESQ